ncbi:MAG: hypothetical protein IJR27_04735, partial [Synergistaceae bacterium]|nr:hypothetical protein [Synergistaceae bacterium]
MNRKLRVLMLSLFAVMFAVSSAFAAITAENLTLTAGDENPATVYGGLGFEGTYTLENDNAETRLDAEGVEVDWTIAVSTTGDEPTDVTGLFNFYVNGTTVDEETGTMTMNFGLGVPNPEEEDTDYTYTVTATVKQDGVDDVAVNADAAALTVTQSEFSAFMDLITYS